MKILCVLIFVFSSIKKTINDEKLFNKTHPQYEVWLEKKIDTKLSSLIHVLRGGGEGRQGYMDRIRNRFQTVSG